MAFTISGIGGYSGITFTTTQPTSYGGLWAWGEGVAGKLGLGDTTARSSPTQVGALYTWSSVSAGGFHSAAIKTDGTLWTWGKNNFGGPLGLGNTTYYSSPKQVGALTTWLQVSAGNGWTLAVKTNGTLWGWGRNNSGQLGLNNTTYYSSPIQIGALTNWSSVSAGYDHALAVKTNGTLWAWARQDYGELGDNGTNVWVYSPKQIGALTNWSSVSAGLSGSFAVKTNGTLWSWGRNNNGKLGLGDISDRASPNQIGALTTWSSVANGGVYAVAIKTDGTLWSWGYNAYGQLGLGNATYYSSPKQVGALTTWSKITASSFDSGAFSNTLSIKTDGTLWSWGKNTLGQLGLGDTATRSSPVQIGTSTNWYDVSTMNKHVISITRL